MEGRVTYFETPAGLSLEETWLQAILVFVMGRGNLALSITYKRQHGNILTLSLSYSFLILAFALVHNLQVCAVKCPHTPVPFFLFYPKPNL